MDTVAKVQPVITGSSSSSQSTVVHESKDHISKQVEAASQESQTKSFANDNERYLSEQSKAAEMKAVESINIINPLSTTVLKKLRKAYSLNKLNINLRSHEKIGQDYIVNTEF